jgi:hypothetical protein
MSNPGGMMPSTVRLRALTSICFPTIDGSPPNERCHTSCDNTTTGSAFGLSCSAVKTVPRAGLTPSTSNMLAVTDATLTRSGESPWLKLTAPVVYAPIFENALVCSAYSKYSGGETQNRMKLIFVNWLDTNIRRSGAG